jgi:hypothetical protein
LPNDNMCKTLKQKLKVWSNLKIITVRQTTEK